MFLYDEIHRAYFTGLLRPDEKRHWPLSRLRGSVESAKGSYSRLSGSPTFRHREELEPGKIWFYVASRNQFAAIAPVQQQVADSQLLATPIAKAKHAIIFDTKARLQWYWKPSVILTALRKHLGMRYSRIPDKALMPVGIMDEFLWLMKHKRPKAVVVSNDHTPMSRVVIRTAQRRGIPVIYIPHAQVSEKFPPLNFDLALLTGQAMLDTYRQAGPVKGKVELIGTPKLDEFRSIEAPTDFKRIGICFNSLDKMEAVLQVYHAIANQLPHWQITVRPHPACKAMIAELPPQASVSDPHAETAMEFLKRVDVIIANNSSIALEAAVMNREVISIDMSQGKGPEDYYGFIKHGLVFEASDQAAMIQRLQQIETGQRSDPQSVLYFEACPPGTSATESAAKAIMRFAERL